MKRQVLIYGVIGGILITVLKWTEYRFLVIEHSLEIYGGLVAVTFAVLGIWLGVRLTAKRLPPSRDREGACAVSGDSSSSDQSVHSLSASQSEPTPPFVLNEPKQEELGITRREMEILGLIAQGLSNREIAGKLCVSENTVKTHSSRIFDKLGAKRRTQAVLLGKEWGLLP